LTRPDAVARCSSAVGAIHRPEEGDVSKYLFHGSYTQAGITGVLKDGGTGRRKAVDALAASIGGSVDAMYWAFGKDDFYVIAELPSQAAAVVLLTAEDMDAAVKLHPNYRAPGS
jgi:uncharacterized protein with GYD domain